MNYLERDVATQCWYKHGQTTRTYARKIPGEPVAHTSPASGAQGARRIGGSARVRLISKRTLTTGKIPRAASVERTGNRETKPRAWGNDEIERLFHLASNISTANRLLFGGARSRQLEASPRAGASVATIALTPMA